jgi:DHA1 family bicyclomycin/chloramphenicol resistance-like MFS transporter
MPNPVPIVMQSKQHYLEFVVILGALTAFAPLAIDMYLPALPTIAQALQGSTGQGQFTLASFFVGFALGQALLGPLADRYGRKRPLYAGLVLFVAASGVCALAASMQILAAARFVQAVGACAGAVVGRAMVRDLFEPADTVRVFSTLMLVMGVAPILAPLAGGYLLVGLGWRAIFWFLAAFGLACLLAALRLPETHRAAAPRPLDPGRVLRDYRALLGHRRYLGHVLAGACSAAGMFAYIAGSPFVFIELYGVPPQHYGWLFGSNALGLILASQVNGRLLHRRLGADRVLRIAGWIQAGAGVLLLAVAASGAGGLWGIMLPLFVYITCGGLVMPNATALAMAPFSTHAGTASALLGSVQFGLAACAALALGAWHAESAIPMSAVVALCGVLGMAAHAGLVARQGHAAS